MMIEDLKKLVIKEYDNRHLKSNVRYSALNHIVTFLCGKYGKGIECMSLGKNVLKQEYEKFKQSIDKSESLSGAERSAFNELYNQFSGIQRYNTTIAHTNHISVKNNKESINCECFKPLVDVNSKILVLGTMPGKKSLETGEYYANTTNSFWKIIKDLYNDKKEFKDYKEKCECLLKNGIALWDVLATCERKGSSDENIKKETPNDIKKLLQEYPNIKRIIFNGKNPKEKISQVVECEQLIAPSTSSLNRKIYEEKLEDWGEKLILINE